MSRIYKTTAQYNHLHVITNTMDLLGRGCSYIIYTQGKYHDWCSHSSIRVLLTNTHKQKINKYWLERIHGKYLSCCIHVYIHWIQKLSCESPASLLHSFSTIKMKWCLQQLATRQCMVYFLTYDIIINSKDS